MARDFIDEIIGDARRREFDDALVQLSAENRRVILAEIGYVRLHGWLCRIAEKFTANQIEVDLDRRSIGDVTLGCGERGVALWLGRDDRAVRIQFVGDHSRADETWAPGDLDQADAAARIFAAQFTKHLLGEKK